MTVHALSEHTPEDLAAALASFEEQFTYPLGVGRSFRISHGRDYPRFFRAMGQATCFVAERSGEVVGVVGVALRPLTFPNGLTRTAAYFGDLKISPAARGGRTLLHLAAAVKEWIGRRAEVGFGVVMGGAPIVPAQYTGRLGLPAFVKAADIEVLSITTSDSQQIGSIPIQTVETEQGMDAYFRLSAGRFATPPGNASQRSSVNPTWLQADGGNACGCLEDTRRAKVLIADDGNAIDAAHLSCFAFADYGAGADLLKDALRRAGRLGFQSLFAAVAASDASAICSRLNDVVVARAPAAVHAVGALDGGQWNINTSEI